MSLSRRAVDWVAGVFGHKGADLQGDAALQRAPAPPIPGLARPPVPAPAPAEPVQRLRRAIEFTAEEVENLRKLAHTDPVTGLPNRRHFLGRLALTLGDKGSAACALLIVRVVDLETLNQRLGRTETDRTLAAVADVLAAYPDRVPGAFAGRLNGSDFALVLPVAGVGEETALTLLRALRAAPAATIGGSEIVIGGVEGQLPPSAGDALAAADEALAEAEAGGPFTVEVRPVARPGEPLPVGERAWRLSIELALTEGLTTLAEFPVRNAAGRLLYLECPLRVQLEVGGPFQSAARWLAMASRARLMPRVDLAAIGLALVAIARDGQARSVHVSSASLTAPGFVGDVQRRLEAAPGAASRLTLEVGEGGSIERALPRLREAAAAWRRHGVRLGLAHAGASMQTLPRLQGCGIGHLKIGGRFVRGAGADAAVREFAAALVRLAHGLNWEVVASGVDDEADLAALWSLGFDAATGPAVRPCD